MTALLPPQSSSSSNSGAILLACRVTNACGNVRMNAELLAALHWMLPLWSHSSLSLCSSIHSWAFPNTKIIYFPINFSLISLPQLIVQTLKTCWTHNSQLGIINIALLLLRYSLMNARQVGWLKTVGNLRTTRPRWQRTMTLNALGSISVFSRL